jgi:hypothetical protein
MIHLLCALVRRLSTHRQWQRPSAGFLAGFCLLLLLLLGVLIQQLMQLGLKAGRQQRLW